MTQEDLQAIRAIMQEEIEPIKADLLKFQIETNERFDKMDSRLDKMDARLDKMDERIDRIQEDIEEIKENGEITRAVTNSIGEWIDYYFQEDRPYPVGIKKGKDEGKSQGNIYVDFK